MEHQDSGISAVIAQIVSLVHWLLELSIDAMCALALIVGCCLVPWRIAIVASRIAGQESKQEALRSVGPTVLQESVCEALTLVLALGAPTRWLDCWQQWHCSKACDFDYKLRANRLALFCSGLVDWIGIAGACCAMASPLRFCSLVLRSREIARQVEPQQRTSALRSCWISYGLAATLDVILLPFGLLPLLVPSRTVGHCRAHANLWKRKVDSDLPQRCCNRDDHERCALLCCSITCTVEPLFELHRLWIINSCFALLDIIACTAGLVALCSVVRTKQILAEVAAAKQASSVVISTSWDLSYNWNLRRCCLREMGLTVYDVLSLLPLALVWLTPHRRQPVRNTTTAESACQGPTRVPLVAWRQCALVVADVVVAPLALVALIGPRRADVRALVTNACNDDLFKPHALLVLEATIALHDILLFPFVRSVLWLTAYRQLPSEADVGASGGEYSGPSFGAQRRAAWRALGNVILDLPFVLLAAVVVITGWRARRILDEVHRRRTSANNEEDDWQTRRLVCIETCRLFRDALCLPLALALFVTVYRWPSGVSRLVRRQKPVPSGAPRLAVRRASLVASSRGGRINFCFETSPAEDQEPVSPAWSQLLLRVLGDDSLWERASSRFGAAFVGLVRAVWFPLVLIDGKHCSYAAIANGEQFKLAFRTTKTLSALADCASAIDNERFMLQIESPAEERPVLAVILSVADVEEAARKPGALIQLALDDAHDFTVTTQTSEALDSFYFLILTHFAELVIDLVLGVMCCVLVAVPWRFASLALALCEPRSRYRHRSASLIAKSLKHADQSMDALRKALEPVLNEGAKQCAAMRSDTTIRHDTTPSSNRLHRVRAARRPLSVYTNLSLDVSAQIDYIYAQHLSRWRKMRNRAIERLALVASTEDDDDALALWSSFADVVDETLDFQDASLYYVWLRAEIHGLLLTAVRHRTVSEEAHSLCVEAIDEAQRAAACRRTDLLRDRVSGQVATLRRDADTNRQRVSFKPLPLCRYIVFGIFLEAARDVGFLLLAVCVVATVYRAIPLAKDMARARAFWVTRTTARDIISLHFLGLARDVLLVCTTLLSVIAVCAVVAPAPAFLEALPGCVTLTDVRATAMLHLTLTCEYLTGLGQLIWAWRIYRLALKAACFAYFVPAAAIADGALVWITDKASALRLGAVLFTGLALAAILGRRTILLWGTFVALVLSVLVPAFTATLASSSYRCNEDYCRSSGSKDSLAPRRLTWDNVLVLLAIPIDGIQCAAVLFDKTNASTSPLTVLAQQPPWALYAALGTSAIFVLLLSAPLAELSGENKHRENVPHRHLRHIFGQMLFIFTTHGLIQLGTAGRLVLARASNVLLIAYSLSAASAFSSLRLPMQGQQVRSNEEDGRSGVYDPAAPREDGGIDIVYPPRRVAAIRACQFALLASSSKVAAIAAAGTWILVEIGVATPIVGPLRVAIAALTLLVVLFIKSTVALVCATGLLLTGVAIAACQAARYRAECDDNQQQLAISELSSLIDACADPAWKRELATTKAPNPLRLGRLLRKIELSLPFERLDPDFTTTSRLLTWRRSLTGTQCISYEVLQRRAAELKQHLRTPTYAQALCQILLRLAVKKRLPIEIATDVIYSYALPFDGVKDLLRPVLLCSATSHLDARRALSAHAARSASQVNCLDFLFSLEPMDNGAVLRTAIFQDESTVRGYVCHRSAFPVRAAGPVLSTTGRALKVAFSSQARPVHRIELVEIDPNTRRPSLVHDHAVVVLDEPQTAQFHIRLREDDETNRADVTQRIASELVFGEFSEFLTQRTFHTLFHNPRIFRPNGDVLPPYEERCGTPGRHIVGEVRARRAESWLEGL